MKKGGIVVERMLAGALRADGQRRVIGDTMKETKLKKCSSGATRELRSDAARLFEYRMLHHLLNEKWSTQRRPGAHTIGIAF
jgi:hypothetical protein